MPSPSEKFAQSLEALQQLQSKSKVAIRSTDLSRVHRERLLKNGFLCEVMKGWYIPTRPDQPKGESTAWFATFWSFCADYLRERFGEDWCLSAEQSINLHVGTLTVPRQLVVRSAQGNNNITTLPQNTSILDIRVPPPPAHNLVNQDGLNIFKLPLALTYCTANFFRHNPIEARAALGAIPNASEILSHLLEGGQTIVAGRLAGAFRNVGRERIAEDIITTMQAAGYDCHEEDPFNAPAPILFRRLERSPPTSRIRLMWQTMRQPALKIFPKPLGRAINTEDYLNHVQERYSTDAYHSLSIEGYKVSKQLIERVQPGSWNLETNSADREHKEALAARGYWQSYQAVRGSLRRVLHGEDAGTVADDDHGTWFRELFLPSVTAGLLRPADLSGYRNERVFIRHSMHVPPSKETVRDLMPVFFELLQEERDPAVRVILGHFLFVYIHPYMDGNGRIGRFLMNVMLASGGYPWTVIPVDQRELYLAALEEASVNQNIIPFANFVGKLVKQTMLGKAKSIR
jgi:hypothetical protein